MKYQPKKFPSSVVPEIQGGFRWEFTPPCIHDGAQIMWSPLIRNGFFVSWIELCAIWSNSIWASSWGMPRICDMYFCACILIVKVHNFIMKTRKILEKVFFISMYFEISGTVIDMIFLLPERLVPTKEEGQVKDWGVFFLISFYSMLIYTCKALFHLYADIYMQTIIPSIDTYNWLISTRKW